MRKSLVIIVAFALLSTSVKAQNIKTFAGNGTSGSFGNGGQATSAEINEPFGACFDKLGNFYFSDQGNNCVRMVNSSGVISNFAGSGSFGFSGDGGPAIAANMIGPTGIASDNVGNLYIADFNNNRVRMVNTNGIINTIVGNGTQGYSGDGGPATSSELAQIYGLALDLQGNLYIADKINNRIRKVNTNGIISTFAGNGYGTGLGYGGYSGDGGQATAAELYYPSGVATDARGNVYIADWGNNRIRKVNSNGIISTFTGNGNQGYLGDGSAAISAEINHPYNITIDRAGNTYIDDNGNNVIRRVGTDGIITTIAGNGTAGYSGDNIPSTSAQLNYPIGSATDSLGNVYIADYSNNRIREVVICAGPVTISSNSSYLCNGTSITLTGGGGATYTWSSNAGAAISSTVSVNPSTTTTYTLVGANGMCLDSATFMLNVISPPTPAICMVATDSTSNYQYNIVYWDNTQYPTADSFIVYRYCGGTYLRLGAVVKDSARFVDTYTSICGPGGGDPTVTSYKYVLALRDSCKNLSGQSQYHATTNVATNATNITWNDYLINGAAVAVGYDVYRDSLGNSNFYLYHQSAVSPLNVPSFSSYPNQAFRVDPVLSYTCNIVERLANPTNSPYATRVKSHSNTARQAGGQTTGINKVGSIGQVMVYPNPSTGTFNIQVSNYDNANLEVYNALGQKVLSQTLQTNITQLNLADFSNGIYQLRVVKNNATVYQTKISKVD